MARFSEHARKKMIERGITEQDVEAALRRQVGSPAPGQPGTMWILGYAAGSRILKICVPIADQEYVISAAWPDVEEEVRSR